MDLSELQRQTAAALEQRDAKYLEELKETRARLLDIEQKAAHRPGFEARETTDAFSFAAALHAAPGFDRVADGLVKDFAVSVPGFHKALVNAAGTGQPLVAADRLRASSRPAKDA